MNPVLQTNDPHNRGHHGNAQKAIQQPEGDGNVDDTCVELVNEGQALSYSIDVGAHERDGLCICDRGGAHLQGLVKYHRDKAPAVHGEQAICLVLVDGIGDLSSGQRAALEAAMEVTEQNTYRNANVNDGIRANQAVCGAVSVWVPGFVNKVEYALHKKRLREEESAVSEPRQHASEKSPLVMD